MLFDVNESTCVAVTPVPLSEITLGEVPALLTSVMLPLAGPATDG